MESQKDKDRFIPKTDISYSAGLAFLLLASGVPEIALVLQRGGEKNVQKDGSMFVEKTAWKVPMGHYDGSKDFNLLDAAIREFEEETGFGLSMSTLSVQGLAMIRVKSDRPGSRFHEDQFFLATSDESPEERSGMTRDEVIERVQFFKLTALPLTEPVYGAILAFGHRKKLFALFSESRDYFESINYDIDPVLESLAQRT